MMARRLSAEDAKQLSEDKELNKIFGLIENAALNGEVKVCPILKEEKYATILEALGYDVEFSHENKSVLGKHYTVSW